ncbi:unnamed protein product, partial [Ectocarpus fasciculatus]
EHKHRRAGDPHVQRRAASPGHVPQRARHLEHPTLYRGGRVPPHQPRRGGGGGRDHAPGAHDPDTGGARGQADGASARPDEADAVAGQGHQRGFAGNPHRQVLRVGSSFCRKDRRTTHRGSGQGKGPPALVS